jgi:perosamine synthetase
MSTTTLPAILGGTPARTNPYPPTNTMGPEEKRLAMEVLESGVLSAFIAHDGPAFGGGPMVHAVEDEFCARFGSRYAVSMNSAASGIHAAVAAALCGLGDEVIIPPYTMSTTATSVACTNATPVFADVRPDTFCIDVEDVKRKLSPRTKAIIAVNLFGGPAPLLELRKLADERGLVLIEDNAQAPGATVAGKCAGTVGHIGIFSLNCHKTIQSGEGGIVVTDDEILADRLRLFRNHGEVVQALRGTTLPGFEGLLGYNYRLTELQAAIALAQVRRLDELTDGRIEMANEITRGLRGVPGITAPAVASDVKHVYYQYAMKVDAAELGLSRTQLKAALDAEGVQTGAGYVRPIYLYPMYRENVRQQRSGYGAGIWHPAEGSNITYDEGSCPVTERLHFHELLCTSICRADLGRDEALEFVRAVTKVVEHRNAIKTKLEAQSV